MELNLTRQTITTNHICFNKNVEQNLDFDVNMPDYCAGIQRILKTELVPYIASKNQNGRTLSIEGNACFTVLYVDDQNRIHSFEQTVPFSKSVEIDVDVCECSFDVCGKCGYFNSKAVSSHRLEVHSVIALAIKGVCKREAQVISDIDNSEIFFDRSDTPSTTPISHTEKNIIIEEELEIGAAQPLICDVLRYNVLPLLTGYKIVNDKVVVKGELSVSALYSADDYCKNEKFNAIVPFSQIVDIDGINEECECDVRFEVASVSLKPRASYDGDVKSFLLNAKICICIDTVCDSDIPIVFDAYSSKHGINVGYDNIVSSKIIDKVCDKYFCKKQIEFSDGDIFNVIDLWCSSSMQGHHFEGNTLIINGTVTVCLICQNSEKSVNYFERPIDFEYRCEATDVSDKTLCEPELFVANCDYDKIGENVLDIKAELTINATLRTFCSYNAVVNIELSDEVQNCKTDNFAMMIYFACSGEKIWEIAKHYKASPDEIMQINSVGAVLLEDKALLIPC